MASTSTKPLTGGGTLRSEKAITKVLPICLCEGEQWGILDIVVEVQATRVPSAKKFDSPKTHDLEVRFEAIYTGACAVIERIEIR